MENRSTTSLEKKLKKYLIVFAIVLMSVQNVEVKAGAAHSQAEAVNWATAQIGKGLDYDKVYGNQCVDLIKYYYDYLGCANYAMGNANAYISNTLPSGWQRVYGNYQPGDIAVWKVNHSCSTCNTSSLGHVGIITSADSVGFNAVNQNFNNTPSCTQNWFRISALQCAIRPDFGNGNSSSGSLSYSAINVAWTDTWNALLKGTISNPNRLTVSSVGVQIWDSAGSMVVNHSESCGLKTSTVNQELNIVGEALPGGLRQGETYTFRMWASANGATYQSGVGSFTIKDVQQPVISDISVSDVSETGYTVHCTVTDNFRVDRVQFPTWTVYNHQDDLLPDWGSNSLCRGTANGNSYTYRVNISDHNYELGEYITHIYAYDPSGNVSNVAVPTQNIKKNEHAHSYQSQITTQPNCTTAGVKTFTCSGCGDSYTETIPAVEHKYTKATQNPTCMAKGAITYTCTVCSHSYKEEIAALGHKYTKTTQNSTCTEKGAVTCTCSVCKHKYTEKTLPAAGHKYVTTTTAAVMGKNGAVTTTCKVCKKKSQTIIYAPRTVAFARQQGVYNGRQQIPNVTVKDSNGKILNKRKDYTVSYPRDMKSVGSHDVTVSFKGNYRGEVKLAYIINPKGTFISKAASRKKGFDLKWKKQEKEISGYEVAYSASNKFTPKSTKILTVGKGKTSKSITGLKAKKKYYVRMRTYKTVKGKKYYSDWSKVKGVRMKR